jgi:hypothetical protein
LEGFYENNVRIVMISLFISILEDKTNWVLRVREVLLFNKSWRKLEIRNIF